MTSLFAQYTGAWARASAGVVGLVGLGVVSVLAGCSAIAERDAALFRLFWAEPQDILARAHLPKGLGVEAPPELVLTLIEAPDRPARESRFRLVPAPEHSTVDAPCFHLARRDYLRFLAAQTRVVANLGHDARIAVGLDIAYCAHPDQRPAAAPPVAEVIDRKDDTLLMLRPASATAAALYSRLPPC